MRLPLAVPAALVLLAGALAGCTNSTAGQSATSEASLVFNGASTGTHRSDAFDCGRAASVHATANLGSGALSIQVTDGAGAIVYTKRISSPGQLSDTEDLSNKAAGKWTIVAKRESTGLGGWSGQYAIHVDCP